MRICESQAEPFSISEKKRKAKPTKRDITETLEIFRDFKLPLPHTLPIFKTYAELETYRRKYIMKGLDK